MLNTEAVSDYDIAMSFAKHKEIELPWLKKTLVIASHSDEQNKKIEEKLGEKLKGSTCLDALTIKLDKVIESIPVDQSSYASYHFK